MRALFLIAILLAVPACQKLEPRATQEAKAEQKQADVSRLRQACASQASYDRLKTLVFEKAREVRTGDAAMVDRIAASSVVRMEAPVVKSRDEALNVTVCTGRMVIELPPGAEDAFNGERRLVAEVEYAAQAAVDGSGMVYQLQGAEPIIYRLAAIDLKAAPRMAEQAPIPEPTPTPTPELAQAPAAPPPPAPRVVARPAPRPTPVRQAAVERARPAQARPSFDCDDASTRTERMVCADERLAARDREMAALYYHAVEAADRRTRRVLRDSRDEFLDRREQCDGPTCVARAYEDRVDEIDRIMSRE